MFVRNVLKPSDFVVLVPVGIPATLQYDENGAIQKVYKGHDNLLDITDEIRSALSSTAKQLFPPKVALRGGTTRVFGVFYTSNSCVSNPGNLPECVEETLMSMLNSDPEKFAFFAGSVSSMCASFRGAVSIRNWLTMNKFNVLPGFVVPANLTRETFVDLATRCGFDMQYPRISAYVIINNGSERYVSTRLKQHIVSRVNKCVNEFGSIMARIDFSDTDEKLEVSYSDVVEFNINTNTSVLLDAYNNIIDSAPTDNKKRDKRSYKMTCSRCGMVFDVSKNGLTVCPNERCTSRMYPLVCKMLKFFNLPMLPFDTYNSYLNKNKIMSLIDVLELDEYKDQDIDTSLGNLLASVVPSSVVSDVSVFSMIANRCSNNVDSFKFYITHPDKILSNLKVVNKSSQNLVKWLSDEFNCAEILNLMDMPKIHIASCDRKFQGAPIFRNKKIMITGTFSHGDYHEIMAILQSYSADVRTEFTEDVQCVVVGDISENVNGVALKAARSHDTPVYTESEFFKNFRIDEDLIANLV